MLYLTRKPKFRHLLHVGQHKCLTVYYKRIMDGLSARFALDRIKMFRLGLDHERIRQAETADPGKVVVFHLDSITEALRNEFFPGMRGSHFIRDPRDLVISGTHYHRRCDEEWCRREVHHLIHPQKLQLMAGSLAIPEPAPDEAYQDYLNRLTLEDSFIVEFFRMEAIFEGLTNWNYHDPQMLELRYEEIVGDEKACFTRLFRHYGFPRSWVRFGADLAERLSLQQRGIRSGHVRSGRTAQWREEFTPRMKEIFKEYRGELLIQLGYEKDHRW